ncbi:MAG: hypothetical protein J6L77_01490 [Coprococcus sp.]|nr:hypothetical protein [Coprococcus sp.]
MIRGCLYGMMSIFQIRICKIEQRIPYKEPAVAVVLLALLLEYTEVSGSCNYRQWC